MVSQGKRRVQIGRYAMSIILAVHVAAPTVQSEQSRQRSETELAEVARRREEVGRAFERAVARDWGALKLARRHSNGDDRHLWWEGAGAKFLVDYYTYNSSEEAAKLFAWDRMVVSVGTRPLSGVGDEGYVVGHYSSDGTMVMAFVRKGGQGAGHRPRAWPHDSVIALARILVRALDRDPELQR